MRETRAAVYARVACATQQAKHATMSQLEALRDHAASSGMKIVEEFTDEGYSGLRLDRPGLERIRDLAERLWNGTLESSEAHPVTAQYTEGQEILDGPEEDIGRPGPLGLEHPQADGPPVADVSEPEGVRRADIREEHLAEAGAPVRLPQGPDVDAGAVHVDDEHGEAAVFRHGGVGPGQHEAEVRVAGSAGPDLLPVDHPLGALRGRSGSNAGEVGARSRLAEELAPVVLAGEDAAQEPALLGSGPDGGDRGRHLVDRHEVAPGGGRPGRPQPPVDVGLAFRRHAEPAAAFGEVDPGQSEVELRPQERDVIGGVGIRVLARHSGTPNSGVPIGAAPLVTSTQ